VGPASRLHRRGRLTHVGRAEAGNTRAAWAVAHAIAWLSGTPEREEDTASIKAITSDLVIVGCGIAGLSAAVSALQSGVSVTLLERAPEEEFGGNTRWTEAYLRMKSDTEISDDFEEHFAANVGSNLDPNVVAEVAGDYASWSPVVMSHAFPDPELISTFAAQVPPTIAWLKSFGLKFGPQPIYLLAQNTTRIAAQS
jgi:tricarballylate dehydrogenase